VSKIEEANAYRISVGNPLGKCQLRIQTRWKDNIKWALKIQDDRMGDGCN
jgi:hypothetical protein